MPEFSTGTLRHAMSETLPRLFIVLPSYEAAVPLHLDVEVHAYNVASPVRVQLHVRVEKGIEPSPLELIQRKKRLGIEVP